MALAFQFFGAARQVTGTKHLIEAARSRVLLDCGMVQGPRAISQKLNAALPFAAAAIDACVLSHAHIDHAGSLPLLVRSGFRGPIVCTEATRELLEIMLPDAANLQAADARHLKKRGIEWQPPYDLADVERTLERVRGVPYHAVVPVSEGVTASFLDAGHIIGSAHVVLEVEDGGAWRRVVFTGDHGRKAMPILREPEPLPPADVLITESTYGDRLHPDPAALEAQMLEVVKGIRGLGGRVLIPAFSVGRTQNVLWHLGRLMRAGVIARMPVYVDSPLSTRATAIVARHPELFDREAKALLDSGIDPFLFEGVTCIESVEDSKALNELRQGVIISASGMLEGGRILHHLIRTIDRPEDCVLMVGYQAEGTLGRKLLEGFDTVRIYGERYPVRCQVRKIDGLSAHADWKEMLDHLRPLAPTCRHAFVVHGEEDPASRFALRLEEAGFRDVRVPVYKERIVV